MPDMRTIRSEILDAGGALRQDDLFEVVVSIFTEQGARCCTYHFDEKAEVDVSDERYSHIHPCMYIDETYRITLSSKKTGYVHVFSFGSSGAIEKLFPRESSIDNYLMANQPITVVDQDQNSEWQEQGPETSCSGFHEGFLVVLSKHDKPMEPWDLHIDLLDKPANISRGFLGKAHSGISGIYTQRNEYQFAYFEFEVLER